MNTVLDEYVRRARYVITNIRNRKLSIYDPIVIGDPDLWLTAPELEAILRIELLRLDVSGLPLRTRSKLLNEKICGALGYGIPRSFARTHPRFPGQHFDKYAQKSTNLQIWNEDLDATRRYALIHIDGQDLVDAVRVISGDRLAELDTTGTLTQKYQARFADQESRAELLSLIDTPSVQPWTCPDFVE